MTELSTPSLADHDLIKHIDPDVESHLPFDIDQHLETLQHFEVVAYQKCQEWAEKVPDIVPIISPMIQWLLSEFRGSIAAQGLNPKTGEALEGGLSEQVVTVLKIKLESLWHQLEASIDTVMIVSTAGAGAAVDIGAKELLTKVAAEWASKTVENVAEHTLTEKIAQYTELLGNPNLQQLTELVELIKNPERPEAAAKMLEVFVTAIRNAGNLAGEQLQNPAAVEAGTDIALVFQQLLKNPNIGSFIHTHLQQSEVWPRIQAKVGQLGEKIETQK